MRVVADVNNSENFGERRIMQTNDHFIKILTIEAVGLVMPNLFVLFSFN